MVDVRLKTRAGSRHTLIWQNYPPYPPKLTTFSSAAPAPNSVCYQNNLVPQTLDYPRVTITSTKTPGYYVKKKINVKWVPKKYPLKPPSPLRLTKIPVKRGYKPPVFKEFKEVSLKRIPKFRDPRKTDKFLLRLKRLNETRLKSVLYQRLSKIELSRRRYAAYERRYKLLVLRIQKKNALRQAKFDRASARYRQLRLLSETGLFRYSKVKSCAKPVKNSYDRTTVWDYGMSGFTLLQRGSASRTSFQPNANGPYAESSYPDRLDCPFLSMGIALPSFTSTATTAAESRAIQKLYSNLNEQSVHIGNMVAERAQTFSMIRDLLQRLLEFKRNPLSLLKYFTEKGTSKRVGNDFLAYKFGLEPLVKDIYEATTALKNAASTIASDTITVTAKGSSSDTYQILVTETPTPYKRDWLITESVSVYYSLDYKVVNGASAALSQLGLQNPAEILWEVMPWSFVIDWIYPVGNYIRSFSAEAGLTYLLGTKTVVTKRTYSLLRTLDYKQGSNHWIAKWQGRYEVETKVRTVLTTPPTPRLPRLKSPLSTFHILEALALLRQRL